MECDSQQLRQPLTTNSEEVNSDTKSNQSLHHQSDRLDLGPVEKRMKASEFAEYDELINELADQLKIARHPDSVVVLKAASLLLETANNAPTATISDEILSEIHDDTKTRASGRLNKDGSGRPSDDKVRIIQQSKLTLDDVLLPRTLVSKSAPNTRHSEEKKEEEGVEDINKKYDLANALERAAKTLKLLYLDDQRQLQNQVNELISSVQSITANPRTDPRLLATGR